MAPAPTSTLPPWAHGPAELIRHADGHMSSDGDTDRRLALIGFDNAVEVCVETFVNLPPRMRGFDLTNEERRVVLSNYNEKISFLERYVESRGVALNVSIEQVLWYHTLRNELYHSANGMTPERRHVVGAREGAYAVFSALFDYDLTRETTREEAQPATGGLDTAGTRSDGRLAFLAAYATFDQSLARALGRSSSASEPVPHRWAELAQRRPAMAQRAALVQQVVSARNSLVHGDIAGSPSDEMLVALARELRQLTEDLVGDSELAPPVTARGVLYGRRLAEAAHAIAMEVDPDRRGVDLRELRDVLTLRGLRIRGSDSYRAVYSALQVARDLFERVGPATFQWKTPAGERSAGLSGRDLIAAAYEVATVHDPDAAGIHYAQLVRLVEAERGAVRGPNKEGTLYSILQSPAGQRHFRRSGRGVFAWKARRGTRGRNVVSFPTPG